TKAVMRANIKPNAKEISDNGIVYLIPAMINCGRDVVTISHMYFSPKIYLNLMILGMNKPHPSVMAGKANRLNKPMLGQNPALSRRDLRALLRGVATLVLRL